MATSVVKPCGICFQAINLEEDSYIHLIDYFQGKFKMEGYYHNQCYNNKIKIPAQANFMAMGLLKRANKMMDNIDGGKEMIDVELR